MIDKMNERQKHHQTINTLIQTEHRFSQASKNNIWVWNILLHRVQSQQWIAWMKSSIYLTVQVETSRGREACQKKQRHSQTDGLNDEEQVVDQDPHEHQSPGPISSLATLSKDRTDHVHAEENHAHASVGAAGHIPARANRVSCFNSTGTFLHAKGPSVIFTSGELTVLWLVHSCTFPLLWARPAQYNGLISVQI